MKIILKTAVFLATISTLHAMEHISSQTPATLDLINELGQPKHTISDANDNATYYAYPKSTMLELKKAQTRHRITSLIAPPASMAFILAIGNQHDRWNDQEYHYDVLGYTFNAPVTLVYSTASAGLLYAYSKLFKRLMKTDSVFAHSIRPCDLPLNNKPLQQLKQKNPNLSWFRITPENECGICMSTIETSDFSLPCQHKHEYHAHCLETWWQTQKVNPQCPLCQKAILSPKYA